VDEKTLRHPIEARDLRGRPANQAARSPGSAIGDWASQLCIGVLSVATMAPACMAGTRCPTAPSAIFRLTAYRLVGMQHTTRYGAGDVAEQTSHGSKTKLLTAALNVIRAKGYAATTVDDICHAASLTKGSFFHHFKSKDDLALSAAAYWGELTEGFFAAAPYHQSPDPLQRLFGYVEFRAEILQGELADYTCLLGTLVQETYATHPAIRAACDHGMSAHIALLTQDIAAARKLYAPEAQWSAESVGYFIQSVLQGAFIFAKAKQGPEIVREDLAHLRRYLGFLFNQPCNSK
jgi:TetR/AcrR family transcriptional repressor of nem operon